MARKPKVKESSPGLESDNESTSQDETLSAPPSEINPYEVLSLERTATADQIKSAYRKAALRYHPDKAAPEQKDESHKKFQEIAFAYAILSDERRRKRYDATGNTNESLEGDDDFDWVDFFRSQTEQLVTQESLDKIKREYQGSDEEKSDLLQSYQENEGNMDGVYEEIMCSNVLDDDERFRRIIDGAIKNGDVEAYGQYTKESKTSRKKRLQRAKAEEAEAMELAEELGVKDKLFGRDNQGVKTSTSKKTKNSTNGEDALRALIQQRQQSRSENFFDNLEAKYGGGKNSGGKSKRKVDEPPEELFQKNAKKARGKA